MQYLWRWSLVEVHYRRINFFYPMHVVGILACRDFGHVRILTVSGFGPCRDFGRVGILACRDFGRVGILGCRDFDPVGILGCRDFGRRNSGLSGFRLSGLCPDPLKKSHYIFRFFFCSKFTCKRKVRHCKSKQIEKNHNFPF